ncbi:aminoacyl-tRNA hydrolase [Candidatus Dojkabacteria bacterium]|nr:aminoacyl-tRNA hydrolase [Candidatus Dojkabacteria bacterium]
MQTNFKIIFGLGNPGTNYSNTRHNAGFFFIDKLKDYLADSYSVTEENKKEYSAVTIPNLDLVLVKPLLFMNNSGIVIRDFLKYHNYNPKKVLIAFDDLDIELGEYKIQQDKYPKDHNGINSILEQTGESGREFFFLRIGINNRGDEQEKKISGIDYVLQKFSKQERQKLEEGFEGILQNYF